MDNLDKEKLILMLQVRQVISLVTCYSVDVSVKLKISLPSFLLAHHPYIALHFDRNCFWVLFLMLLKLYPCNNVVLVIQN